MSRHTWLLDPGHGGLIDGVYQTRGKRSPPFDDGSVLYEGVFNRDVVERVMRLCEQHDIQTVNVVNTNEDMPLSQRVGSANLLHQQNSNSIYLSIHANAFGNGTEFNSARGVCTFHHSRSSKGQKIAEVLQPHLVSLTGFRDRGVKANESWANFYVLRKTHMPAILSENGFMTNLQEAQALMTSDTRQQIAEAHFAMIMEIENNGL